MRQAFNIIDGNYFVNFASHSSILNLRGPNGEPTGALHSFFNTLWNIKQKNKGKLTVVFDGGRAAFRNQLFPGYKKKDKRVEGNFDQALHQIFEAEDLEMSEKRVRGVKRDIFEAYDGNRTDSLDEIEKIIDALDFPADIAKRLKKDFEYIYREEMKNFTFNTLYRLLPVMGIPMVKIPEQEADDVIYVLAKHLKKDFNIYCITSDEDFVQMVRLGATVILYRQDEIITANNFEKKYDFPMEFFTLYKALKGDSSDKIDGVPGVGPKNAAKIVKDLKAPTIENLIDYCTDSKNKKLQAVLENLKIVKRNIRLMDLEYIDLEDDFVLDYYDRAEEKAVLNFPLVKKIFHDLGLAAAGTKWLGELNK